jgi:hypothetical protein
MELWKQYDLVRKSPTGFLKFLSLKKQSMRPFPQKKKKKKHEAGICV